MSISSSMAADRANKQLDEWVVRLRLIEHNLIPSSTELADFRFTE